MHKHQSTDNHCAEMVRRSGSVFQQYNGEIAAPARRGNVRPSALRIVLGHLNRESGFDLLMGKGKRCQCEDHQLPILRGALQSYKINGRREFLHDNKTNRWICLSILLYRATGPKKDLSIEQVIAYIAGAKEHNTANSERNRSQAKWKTQLIGELRAGKTFPKPDYGEEQQTLFGA